MAPPSTGVGDNQPVHGRATSSLAIISYVCHGLCLLLVSLCVALRLYGRRRVRGSLDAEDFFCFLAWIFVVGYCITTILYTTNGGALHIWELNRYQLIATLKTLYAIMLLFIVGLSIIKLSLLLLMVRIFFPHGWLALFIRGLAAFIASYYIVILFVRIFVCTPISSFWNGGGDCLNLDAIYVADAFISMITDTTILVLPIILVWNLRLPLRKKIRVACILGFGGLATVANIYRLVITFHYFGTHDQTYYTIHLLYSATAEIGLGFICACLPAISSLLTHDPDQGAGMAQRQVVERVRPDSEGAMWWDRSSSQLSGAAAGGASSFC